MSGAARAKLSPIPDDVSPEMLEKVRALCMENRGKPGALIPVLQETQEIVGYLPVALLERIAQWLGVAGHEVFGVATFYSFFSMKPKGRHTIRVCLGTACYVRGGKEAFERLQQHLGISGGQTTPDRRFTLEDVRCLGACGVAPVVVVDSDTHRKVKADAIVELIERYA